jgi:hypothetical protein
MAMNTCAGREERPVQRLLRIFATRQVFDLPSSSALSPQLRDRQAAPSPVFKFDLLDGHESRVKGLVQDLKQKLTDALDKSAFLFGGHGVIF